MKPPKKAVKRVKRVKAFAIVTVDGFCLEISRSRPYLQFHLALALSGRSKFKVPRIVPAVIEYQI